MFVSPARKEPDFSFHNIIYIVRRGSPRSGLFPGPGRKQLFDRGHRASVGAAPACMYGPLQVFSRATRCLTLAQASFDL